MAEPIASNPRVRKRATARPPTNDEHKDSEGSFPCPVCGNLYEKQRSRDRHISYCKRKASAPNPPRRTSCFACIAAKIRCDRQRPSCSACGTKRKKCEYAAPQALPAAPFPDSTKGPSGSNRGGSPGSSRDSEEATESSRLNGNLDPGLRFDEVAQWSLPLHAGPEGGGSSESPMMLHSAAAWDPFFNPTSNNWDVDISMMECTKAYSQAPPGFQIDSSPVPLPTPWTDFMLSSSAGVMVPHMIRQRSLVMKKLASSTASANGQFILQTLRTYPRMMLRKVTLPPFIHPYCSLVGGDGSIDHPLSVCINIIQMFYARTPQSSPFVWKSIRFEQERLFNQCVTLDKWKLLAAAQSIILFILLRIIEGPTDDNNFDTELILTLEKVFMCLHEIRPAYALVLKREAHRPGWEDWVWAESTNRIAIVYYLLTIFMECGVACDDYDYHVLGAPIPCKKAVWEASNRATWNIEYDIDTLQSKADPTMTCGRLFDLHHQAKHDDARTDLLDRVYSDCDALGSLVLLATALI